MMTVLRFSDGVFVWSLKTRPHPSSAWILSLPLLPSRSASSPARAQAVMKQMLKPFKPAEDRFAGMEVARSEASGAVIIPDAAAYLECTVAGRMEAGDHWLVYASVEGGKVLDEAADSAVHFRKVGTTY